MFDEEFLRIDWGFLVGLSERFFLSGEFYVLFLCRSTGTGFINTLLRFSDELILLEPVDISLELLMI